MIEVMSTAMTLPAPATVLAGPLSPETVASFTRDGYAIGRGVVSDADLQPVRTELAAWLDAKARELHAAGTLAELHADADFNTRYGLLMAQNPAIQDGFDVMYLRGQATFGFFHTPRLLDAVQQLIGPEISLNPISHYRAKPPIAQTVDALKGYFAVPWHQDTAVTVPEADASEIITCWIPLVDVDIAMGCLQVLPGAHRLGYLEHHASAGYGTAIKPELMPRTTPVKLEVRAGDAIFMHRLCPHHSGPNRTQRCRWSFDMRFHRTGDNSGRPWQPEFVLRSANVPVATDHAAWATAWERCLAAGGSHGKHRVAS